MSVNSPPSAIHSVLLRWTRPREGTLQQTRRDDIARSAGRAASGRPHANAASPHGSSSSRRPSPLIALDAYDFMTHLQRHLEQGLC